MPRKTRRGGHLTLDRETQTALAIVNKSVREIVHEHLTPDEVQELCAIWKVEVTDNPANDAVSVYKEMESQPGLLYTMVKAALK